MVRGPFVTNGAIAHDNIAGLDILLECATPGHQNHFLCAHYGKLFRQFHYHRRTAAEARQHSHPAFGFLYGIYIRIHCARTLHRDAPTHTVRQSALQTKQSTLRFYLGHSPQPGAIGNKFVCGQ